MENAQNLKYSNPLFLRKFHRESDRIFWVPHEWEVCECNKNRWVLLCRLLGRGCGAEEKSAKESAFLLKEGKAWDPSFPLENTKSPPRPENPGNLLKHYNSAHPGPVLKVTEKSLKIAKRVIF